MAKKNYAPIANDHHVVRRCGYQVIERDLTTKQVIGLYPSAMRLRRKIDDPKVIEDDTYLSTNWLEYFGGSKVARLKQIVAAHRAKMGRISPDSGVAVLNSGRIEEIGRACRHRLKVLHTGKTSDPSYSRITGLPLDNSDETLLVDLATEAYKDFMLLRDVDAAP